MTNNISNRGSAFFVADQPTPEQVLQFATETLAFFFIVHTNHVVSALVTLEQHPKEDRGIRYAFRIIRDPGEPSTLVPLDHTHDIPDLRAYEIKHGPWGEGAELSGEVDGTLEFEGRTYRLLPLPLLLKDLTELIQTRDLHREID